MIEIARRSILRAMLSFVIFFPFTGCVSIDFNPNRSGEVYINEPVMAKGTDEQHNPIEPTTIFKTTDKRIYCTISVEGPEGVRLSARWYYGEKLIYDKMIDLGKQRRGAWWLKVAPGQKFPAGDYRIEIYLTKEPLKVVMFKVVE